MATLTQPPFKFWSASEYSGHLLMALKGEDIKVNLLHIFSIRLTVKSIMLWKK